MTDLLVFVGLSVAFGALITAHVALLFGLWSEPPRWRFALALVIPPLAPYWGLLLGLRWRGGLWLLALVAYLVLLALGSGAGG